MIKPPFFSKNKPFSYIIFLLSIDNKHKSYKIIVVKPIVLLSIYNLITLSIVTVLLIMCKNVIRKDSTKDKILKYVSIAVVIIHYSALYYDFFAEKGDVDLGDSFLFPIYPCHIVMWMLVAVAFIKNRNTVFYKSLAEFTFLVGTVCGLVGVLYNFNFLDDPYFTDYWSLKGLLSHTVMIFGTIFIGVMGYVKIRVPNTMRSLFWGLVFFASWGGLMNFMFRATGIDEELNAMYMMEPPIPALPFLNFFVLGGIGLLLAFAGLLIFEKFALPVEERWLTKVEKERENKYV